ncbi:hypothetical protein [Marinobacterium sedimentorum]|uniref:hypothetical protein n=1 Tax=Marinobacterium sedimentorum TaxID=2927804 RepID=UPI0020C5E10F|nr:hypothetical protein [Marinobacterium sedimentorum]MCP8688036.1 hypothetical protein [Marinobacterium sedimentorum]
MNAEISFDDSQSGRLDEAEVLELYRANGWSAADKPAALMAGPSSFTGHWGLSVPGKPSLCGFMRERIIRATPSAGLRLHCAPEFCSGRS